MIVMFKQRIMVKHIFLIYFFAFFNVQDIVFNFRVVGTGVLGVGVSASVCLLTPRNVIFVTLCALNTPPPPQCGIVCAQYPILNRQYALFNQHCVHARMPVEPKII